MTPFSETKRFNDMRLSSNFANGIQEKGAETRENPPEAQNLLPRFARVPGQGRRLKIGGGHGEYLETPDRPASLYRAHAKYPLLNLTHTEGI